MSETTISPFLRLVLRAEEFIMTRLVPMDGPGPVFRWLFKTPVFFYRIGLPIFSGFILLLTTTGRKSGKPRQTPLEYRFEPETGSYIVMAGWGGKTDWYRNAQANPNVHVRVGRRKFQAIAEPLPEEEVVAWLMRVAKVNPRALIMFSRWAGETLDGSEAGLRRAAKYFPSLRLRPIDAGD
jgi:deazaflavin-dependent oxidoreductase (nitroreductase family)